MGRSQYRAQMSALGCAWEVIVDERHGRHVMPINDLRQHRLENCFCTPFDEDGITVHNSLDGREAVERGDRRAT